jgi:hypothetical protein
VKREGSNSPVPESLDNIRNLSSLTGNFPEDRFFVSGPRPVIREIQQETGETDRSRKKMKRIPQ